MRFSMAAAIAVILATTVLIGSFAFADDGKFDSLEGRTQLGASGSFSVDNSGDNFWSTGSQGFYYLTPHFGLGGEATLAGGSSFTDVGILYGLGPAIEYFIPIADRQHVFFQASAFVSGYQRSASRFALGASAGYRYFVSDDIALSIKLSQQWLKQEGSDANFNRIERLNVHLGFALFF